MESKFTSIDYSTGTTCLENDSQIENTEEEIDALNSHGGKDVHMNISVPKTDISFRRQRKISMFAHKLKRLSQDGSMHEFNELVKAANNRIVIRKLKMAKCVRSNMEASDIRFIALEAQLEARRLKYDTSLTDKEILVQMESEIKFTSNPTVSSMVYLARLGSSPFMTTTIDNGLAYLQYAKQHSMQILPCKESGLMLYLEANLLSKKVECNPSKETREEVLRTITHALSQFHGETDDIRKDYTRMLMLRMAYCYLGLNLFGKKIKHAQVTDSDRKFAKTCLDYVECPDIWERMESRRKMLYHIAKAQLYRQEQVIESSIMHAKEAELIAQRNCWTAELPNIKDLIAEIESSFSTDAIAGKSDDGLSTFEDMR